MVHDISFQKLENIALWEIYKPRMEHCTLVLYFLKY